jgi:hypothetical protein
VTRTRKASGEIKHNTTLRDPPSPRATPWHKASKPGHGYKTRIDTTRGISESLSLLSLDEPMKEVKEKKRCESM